MDIMKGESKKAGLKKQSLVNSGNSGQGNWYRQENIWQYCLQMFKFRLKRRVVKMAHILMLIGEKTPCVKICSLNLQVVEYIRKCKQGQCGPGALPCMHFCIY